MSVDYERRPDDETTLANYETRTVEPDQDTADEPAEPPSWTPGESTTGTRCQNCETTVTKQFARVFGDSDDILYHCSDCGSPDISFRDLKQGAGSDPDYDPAVDRGTASEHAPIFNGGGL